jgi:hypothetical protein
MVPLVLSVAPWSVQLSMTSCPLTHKRTPSSEVVVNV